MHSAPWKIALVFYCFLQLDLNQARGISMIDWIHQYGSSASDEVSSISADSLGNVFIAGETEGNIGGPYLGGRDAFLIKYDSSGNFAWARKFGTQGLDSAEGCSADGLGNVYIAGIAPRNLTTNGSHNAFVTKYNGAGDLLWYRQLGVENTGAFAQGVAADRLGNVFVTGSGDVGPPAAGFGDAFLAKYSGSGDLQWSRQFNTGYDNAYGVTADALGNAYVAGSTVERLDGPHGLVTNIALTKYDPNGNQLWTRQFGSNQDDFGLAVAADSLGNTYVTGVTNAKIDGLQIKGPTDAFLAKFDSAGNRVWTRLFGGTGDDRATSVSVDDFGNVFVSGTGSGDLTAPASSRNDALAAQFDSDGNLLKVWQFGNTTVEYGFGAATDGLGNFYVGGHTGGALGPEMNAGNFDAYLVKFSVPEPTSIATAALGALGLLLSKRRKPR